MFRQAALQSERLQCDRKGCSVVGLRSSWVLKIFWFAEVFNSRKIIKDFQNIYDGQAKIIAGVVMVSGSRKVAGGCADTRNGCSEGHYGLMT